MKIETGIKAGGLGNNHNEAQGGLKVQTGIKAGGLSINHNEAQAKGLKVQTGIKAGTGNDKIATNHNEALVRGS